MYLTYLRWVSPQICEILWHHSHLYILSDPSDNLQTFSLFLLLLFFVLQTVLELLLHVRQCARYYDSHCCKIKRSIRHHHFFRCFFSLHTNNVIQGKVFECLKSNLDQMLQKITGHGEFQDALPKIILEKPDNLFFCCYLQSAGIQYEVVLFTIRNFCIGAKKWFNCPSFNFRSL